MENRDYLVKRLEAFLKFIAMLMGLKEKENPAEAIEKINEAFSTYSGLSTEEIETIQPENFITYIHSEKKVTTEQQEQLAELLYWKAVFLKQSGQSYTTYFKKSLLLFQHIQDNSKIFSLERENRIQEIIQHL